MSEKFVDPFVAELHATRAAMLEGVGGSVSELMRQVWQKNGWRKNGGD